MYEYFNEIFNNIVGVIKKDNSINKGTNKDKNIDNDKEMSSYIIIIKYFLYWIIGMILIILIYLLLHMVCNYIGELPSFYSPSRVKLRRLTPNYPPPLTNFIDSNDFFRV